MRLLAGVTLIAALLFSGASWAENREVRLINESSQNIVQFHASNIERGGWEEDILGQDVVRPGKSVVINIDDGSGHCLYDFKTVMANGHVLFKRRVDVCKTSSYRISD